MGHKKSSTMFWIGLALLWTSSAQAEVRDGKLYDPGVERQEPAEKAPEDLKKLASFVGDWQMELEITPPGQDSLRSSGFAKVTYMNRGHGLMERTRVADFDGQGHPMATMAFLAVDGNGAWGVGEGNSWNESIRLTSGGFDGERLVLYDGLRPGGGMTLMWLRRTLQPDGPGFVWTTELSTDMGETWQTTMKRTYRRQTATTDGRPAAPFAVRDDVGLPAPGRPAEAAQFDFLLGEHDARHWLQTPQRVVRWPANATAVHALDGHGILEFSWFDLDPTLPDAATSILRVYNRAMRRWESLFLPNRGNTLLHFGGVEEGDRIVLHPFAAQTGSSPLSQWIFFDQHDDGYRWKGRTSNDRGQTYNLSWGIDFQRKGSDPFDAVTAPAVEVTTTAADGVQIFGDHYRSSWPGAPTVVLFHQAGSDARGEYGTIARRLVKEGYEVFAWDARSGGDRFEGVNRTVQAQAAAELPGYCEAYPDLVAGLAFAQWQGSGGPMFAVGSSYSAALVVRLAAEQGSDLAGVVAFSPASGRMGECDAADWLHKVDGTPVLAFRPRREMANASVQTQAELFAERDVELFISEDGVHGASMLVQERVDGDVEAAWERFLGFLSDPKAAALTP